MTDLTLVIPAKNESESLPSVLEELKEFDYKKKIILQEDDLATISSIRNYDVEIIYQKNKGYGDALITGIKNVDTKYFCIFNADGSFNPNEIANMITKLENENLDIIFASRYEKNSGSEDDTILTYVGNKIFTLIGKIFFSLGITDILYTFVLGKTKKCNELNLKSENFNFCVELPIKAKRNSYNLGTIESFERKRIAGQKKVNEFSDGLKILNHLIYLYFKKK
tara:strand:- start:119 stop:790 length:672 start_codon:yes stop_codon:yes gene_type:complete